MTVVVGVSGGGVAALICDDFLGDNDTGRTMVEPKAFWVVPNKVAAGCAFSLRTLQVLKRSLPRAVEIIGEGVEATPGYWWMSEVFIPALAKAFDMNGMAIGDDMGGPMIVNVCGQIWEVQADRSFASYSDGFAAVGAGGDSAVAIMTGMALKYSDDDESVTIRPIAAGMVEDFAQAAVMATALLCNHVKLGDDCGAIFVTRKEEGGD